jgi:5-bromo-4-chloroindolyl phosphate hydrolysis protein
MTKPTNQITDIALIKSDISYMKSDIGEIKNGIKGLPTLFASKEELKDVAKETEIRLGVLEKKVEGPARFIVPILTAVGSSLVTFLLIQYLEKLQQI